MKWGRWVAIGVSGVAAITVLALLPQFNIGPQQQAGQQRTKQQIMQNTKQTEVPRPAEEKQLKQLMLRRDVTATERLARLDAKRHLQALAEGIKDSSLSKLSADIRELQKGISSFVRLCCTALRERTSISAAAMNEPPQMYRSRQITMSPWREKRSANPSLMNRLCFRKRTRIFLSLPSLPNITKMESSPSWIPTF